MTKSQIVDITVYLHHETDRAVLISDDGESKNAKWLPKSMVEVSPSGSDDPNEIIVTMPEWLAREKEFI